MGLKNLLSIKNLSFEYFRRDENEQVTEIIEAIKDVSLDVKQGQFIVILGKNGSGKSTLAKQINALLLPSEGSVIVDGMDTEEEGLRLQIRKTAGMIFQNPDNQLVTNLVEEDVAFGPENLGIPTAELSKRVTRSLAWTGMEQARFQSPNHLSGGQKQRVAIAGVLAMEPKCIIFDEATAMLNPSGRKQILDIAKKLQKEQKCTIILITHHMAEACLADSVFVMKNGTIALSGTPWEVFDKQDCLRECGLRLPEFLEYMHFLIEHDILGKEECFGITSEEELLTLLENKFRNTTVRKTPFQISRNQRDNKELKGLLLHEVGYTYNKGFADEKKALNHVNVSIGRGEFVAVIGHTGSGKSTFMQMLNGLLLPTEGTVFFDGKDISDEDFSLKELRQKIGFVFQYPEYQLFAETVEKDVCFGPENMKISKVEAQKRAYEAIGAVGLPDTIYDVSPLQLSGGQKRRVAIAGVLAMKPEFLVLDEPTVGLDPQASIELLSMIKHLQVEQGITVVMVSHDMEQVAEFADRVIVFDKGEVILDGLPDEVFGQSEVLYEIGLQIPFGMEIIQRLRSAGVDLELRVFRKQEINTELMKLRGNE